MRNEKYFIKPNFEYMIGTIASTRAVPSPQPNVLVTKATSSSQPATSSLITTSSVEGWFFYKIVFKSSSHTDIFIFQLTPTTQRREML